MGTQPPESIIEHHQWHSTSDDAGVGRKLREMIRLDSADQPINRRVVATPGGFAWWYAEVLDPTQTGVVVIWSFGLPFLPGYMSSARRGQAETPCERAAVNIVTYRNGIPDFYVLHEYRAGDVSWDGRGSWRFGDTHFECVDEGSTRTIDAHIDIPMAREGRLQGRLRFGGPIPKSSAGAAGSEHAWTPIIAPSFGTAMLTEKSTGYRFRASGRGYVDRNASTKNLEELGIQRWFWAHSTGAEVDRVAYALWPTDGGPVQCHGFEIARNGVLSTHQLSVECVGECKRPLGMTTFDRVRFTTAHGEFLQATLDHIVDDGPFYLRYLTKSEHGHGSAEMIEPSRIDRSRAPALCAHEGSER